MQYHHIYHAGNFADVFKHCVLVMLMQSLLQKDKPILYLDTHAGIARYDLNSPEAQKTKEHVDGIMRVYNIENSKSLPPAVDIYLKIVRQINNEGKLAFYPGSPLIVRSLLRKQDKIILAELFPDDAALLKQYFKDDKSVAVHHMNGYQSLKAFLPPKIGRGLILIDPAFEDRDELQKIIAALKIALERFPIGIYAIWYPIKEPKAVRDFYAELKKITKDNLLVREFTVKKTDPLSESLNSCGMAIINPPWKFAEELKPLMKWLNSIFNGCNLL